MSGRSGKRLTTKQRQQRAERRSRRPRRDSTWACRHIVPAGLEAIHQAIRGFVAKYLWLYLRQPDGNLIRPALYQYLNGTCDLAMDIHRPARVHGGYTTYFPDTRKFRCDLASPQLLAHLATFLDECLLRAWGCGEYAMVMSRPPGCLRNYADMLLKVYGGSPGHLPCTIDYHDGSHHHRAMARLWRGHTHIATVDVFDGDVRLLDKAGVPVHTVPVAAIDQFTDFTRRAISAINDWCTCEINCDRRYCHGHCR